MTLDVETIVAVSLMMAVFSAVAAVGSSLVLGAGFERLRCGFEIVRKQTGFFSDAIHQLEQKVETVDKQANNFSHSINELHTQVVTVGEQASLFGNSMKKLEQKVDIVDKQAAFFGDAIYKLEKKIDVIDAQEQEVAEKLRRVSETTDNLLSIGANDLSGSESLLLSGSIAQAALNETQNGQPAYAELRFAMPSPSYGAAPEAGKMDMKSVRYH